MNMIYSVSSIPNIKCSVENKTKNNKYSKSNKRRNKNVEIGYFQKILKNSIEMELTK